MPNPELQSEIIREKIEVLQDDLRVINKAKEITKDYYSLEKFREEKEKIIDKLKIEFYNALEREKV